MTRKQIEAMLAANRRSPYAIASVTTNEVLNLCTLALQALEKQGLEVKDTADYLVEASDQQEIEELRAENERLLAAMVKARDGLRWAQTHLQEADMRSVSVEEGLNAAEAALEEKRKAAQ